MESKSSQATNVICFPGARSSADTRCDQKSLMDAVYAAGSLPVAAGDRATKATATRLTLFGFVVIDEVQADGTARRLRPSEAFRTSASHPWRISKPSGGCRTGCDLPDSHRNLFAAPNC